MNIVLCPGSAENQKFKRWNVNNFLSLGKRFVACDHTVSILLGPEEIYMSKNFKDFKLVNSPTFKELNKVASESDLVICNDSFLLHYFCFSGAKVLALYGPTDPVRTMPPNAFKISSKNPSNTMPCWGTRNYGKCDNGSCSCFDNLEVEDVFIKSLDILKKNS